MASMAVAAPVTPSPPENTPSTVVSKVRWLTSTVCQRVRLSDSPKGRKLGTRPSTSSCTRVPWPMAAITNSQSMRNSEPRMGLGLRRPLWSGSPSSKRMHSTPATRPFTPRSTRTGATRKSLFTPSCSASHHQHPAGDVDPALEAELLEEVDAGQHPRGVLVLYAHLGAVPRPQPQEDGVVAALLQAGHREVAPELDVGGELDAEIEDLVDLQVEHVLGQAVLGDAVAQHAPRLGLGLEHRNFEAAQGEVVGAGQPRRARPHHRHLLAVGRGQSRAPGG